MYISDAYIKMKEAEREKDSNRSSWESKPLSRSINDPRTMAMAHAHLSYIGHVVDPMSSAHKAVFDTFSETDKNLYHEWRSDWANHDWNNLGSKK